MVATYYSIPGLREVAKMDDINTKVIDEEAESEQQPMRKLRTVLGRGILEGELWRPS